jgi:hypothetical protein
VSQQNLFPSDDTEYPPSWYATWEELLHDLETLWHTGDPMDMTQGEYDIWMKYTDHEMSGKFVPPKKHESDVAIDGVRHD